MINDNGNLRGVLKGELVETWFDQGCGRGSAMGGPTILYGVCIAAGPKTARIRWESGLTNRVKHDDYGSAFKPAKDVMQARIACFDCRTPEAVSRLEGERPEGCSKGCTGRMCRDAINCDARAR